jgi:hypothetical protein
MQDDLEYKTIAGCLFARPVGNTGKAVWSNQTPSGQNKLAPSADRWKERSETYKGIAKAIAKQWSEYILTPTPNGK